MGRLIAVGDIHGCYWEFEQLLDHLSPTDDDTLLLLGDLVNRGPDSRRVLDLARKAGAKSLLGNHEHRLLQFHWIKDPEILKDYDWQTVAVMEDEDWDYLKHMRLTHYACEHNTLFVHGGFLPNIPWTKQTVSIVTRIQVVDEDGQPRKSGECPKGTPWPELWTGPEFVVYGHTPSKTVKRTESTLCLDTACAHGGSLSAFVLPERQIHQVQARRTYWPKSIPE